MFSKTKVGSEIDEQENEILKNLYEQIFKNVLNDKNNKLYPVMKTQ